MRLRIALAVCLCIVSLVMLHHHPERRWSMDGYTYAVMAQTDAGIQFAKARDGARAFYLQTETGQRHRGIEKIRSGSLCFDGRFLSGTNQGYGSNPALAPAQCRN